MGSEMIGKRVQCYEMPLDSFFSAVDGIVTEMRNGWATVRTDRVMSKWDVTWQDHPSTCLTSCKIDNLEVVDTA